MLVLVLPRDLPIGIRMLVLELLVKLGMLVRVEALSVRLTVNESWYQSSTGGTPK